MRLVLLPLVLIAVLNAFRGAPVAAAEETARILAVRPLTAATTVRGTDGRTHLVYELQAVNQSGPLVTIDSVETLEAGILGILDRLDGNMLAQRLVIRGETGIIVGLAHSGTILMDVSVPEGAAIPTELIHRFTLSMPVRARPGEDHMGAPLPPGLGIRAPAREALSIHDPRLSSRRR
jgi:hypothetical protein